MKRKDKFIVSDALQKEFAQTRKKIASGERKREKLLQKIAGKPSEKLRTELEMLGQSIAENTRQLPSPAFLELLDFFDNFAAQMFEMIDPYDDKLLLTMGDKAPQRQILGMVQESRNAFHDSEQPNASEMFTGMDAILGKLSARIEEKRRHAAERFPELARSLKPREYDMPEEYNELLQLFIEQVEKRDKLLKDFKYAAPEKRDELKANLAAIEESVEEGEQAFAEEYEGYQKRQQYLDGLRNHLKQSSKTDLNELRAHLKKNPTPNGALEMLLREEFPE